MRKTEIILTILILLAIVLNYSRVDFSTLLLVLSCMGLSILYCFLGVCFLNNLGFKEIRHKIPFKGIVSSRIVLSIFSGIVLSMTIIAILFKVLWWGASLIGFSIILPMLSVIAIIALVMYVKTKADFYKYLLIRMGFYGMISFVLFLTPLTTLLEIKYSGYPDYIETQKKLWEDPNNLELHKELDLEREKMYVK